MKVIMTVIMKVAMMTPQLAPSVSETQTVAVLIQANGMLSVIVPF